MPTFAIHHDNSPVMHLDYAAQSWLYIGKLWAHRKQQRVRSLIRAHLGSIRRWKAGEVGSSGMGFGPRNGDAGEGGMA